MAEVVVFHHAQGLTAGMLELAARLRDDGHEVHAPDLYDGRTFDDLELGLAYAREVGFDTVAQRGVSAAASLPGEVVYVGYSLGVIPAQQLAQTKPGVVGAVLLESCVPPSELGGSWPTGVPVQVHGRADDPFFGEGGDIEAARALVAEHAEAELFLYPGDAHLFADSSLTTFDQGSAALVVERLRGFVSGLSAAGG